MANNQIPTPDKDPWFNLPNVKSSVFVADFTTASQGLFYGKIGARDYETDPSIPLTVIDVDDQWHVDVHINVAGLLTQMWCGYWCISLCLKDICGSKYYRVPQIECCYLLPVDPCSGILDHTINVREYLVKESVCGAPYKVSVIASFLTACQIKQGDKNDPGNYKPGGIAASVQLPLLTFYNDKG